MSRRKCLVLQVLCLCFVCMAACDPKQETVPDKPLDTLQDRRARQDVEALLENLPDMLDALAMLQATKAHTLATALDPAQQGNLPVASHSDLPAVRSLYAPSGMTPRWFDAQGELGSDGVAWLASIKAVETSHGLFAAEFYLPQIDDALRLSSKPPAWKATTLTPNQREALTGWFEQNAARFEQDEDNARLLGALLETGAPLAHLQADIDTRTQSYTTQLSARHRADVLLSSALVHYVRRMKLNNPVWTEDRAWPEALQLTSETPKEARPEIKTARRHVLLEESLSEFFARTKAVRDVLNAHTPHFEQYGRLMTSYARYQKIVAEGGWLTLPETASGLKQGASSPDVALIKARLRAEGMWDGDDSETFGVALKEAIVHYQHTHQIWEKGFMTKETWRSMNVPASRRLLRIRYSLERWRNIRIGGDEEFVYVNIPDFHGEVWGDDERKLRFPVVTGSARKEWDKKKRKHVRPRATKLFSDTMEYVVFNPYWNVPKGIVEDEILPKLEEEPDYLETHNYEWHELSSGNRIMRQTPGKHNALGLVKFLFPNDHNIYLHDTNQKGFFSYPIRAFSHGCMRVEDPMKLAEYMLRRDGKWQDNAIKNWTKPGGGEVWVKLNKPLAVHVEYVVVRVDDEGHAHFLADIYDMESKPMTRIASKDRAYSILDSARSLTSAHKKIVAAGL